MYVLNLELVDKGMLASPDGNQMSRVAWLAWLHSDLDPHADLPPEQRELRAVLGV